ncbi:DUF1002 domain-containing protein [Streptococcus sp. zg-JUN1979]|uniref:DUF1002 domain-containing protein n=1 Tax=Streptococcus sp. zg-JUN1979 TaxID=3391450 RepID=UPI0039A51F34
MLFKKVMTMVSLFLLTFLTIPRAHAATTNQVQDVIDESYVQPDYVLGYSLSDSQRSETLSLLGYEEKTDTSIKTLTTSAYAVIMDVADDSSLQLYSSVKIKKLGASKGLTVSIVTPENITKVTEDMYRNAAVTLGIEHAEITVASPIAVTGESALAGIYYSLEQNGASVSSETKSLAQEELSALSDINAENEGKEGYDADKLNVAMTDIKTAVAEGGDKLSEADIQKIVDDTLANYGLTNSMTSTQINLIVNFALNLSKSSVIKNSQFTETLTSLKDSIVSNAKSTFSGIDLQFDASSAIESSKGFLANLWQHIVNFFTGLFS